MYLEVDSDIQVSTPPSSGFSNSQTLTLCIFCNPSCITDSSVVKASKNTKLRSHPTSSFSIRPFCNRNFGCKARHSCTGSCIFAGPFATGNTFCNLVERVRPLQRVKVRQKTSQYRPQPWPSPGVSVRAPWKRFRWQTLTARSIGVVAVYLSVLASWQAPSGNSRDPHDRGATVELFLRSRPTSSCMCFVLNLSGVSELLSSSPSFEMIIGHRLMALATDSGTFSSISREFIPALRISFVSPVPTPPCPLSADRDAPSKHHELFGAADDMYQRATALSGAEEETADVATIPKLEGW